MLKLLFKKTTQLAILLPLLHMGGYYYAHFHPRFRSIQNFRDAAENRNYFEYIWEVLRTGDIGTVGGTDIKILLANAFANSLILILTAFTIAVVFGILIGVLSIAQQTKRGRAVIVFGMAIGSSLPGFFLGGVIISIFVALLLSGNLQSLPLPISGCGGNFSILKGTCGFSKHIILPLIVLAVRPTLQIAKITSSLLEVELSLPHIIAGQGRGLNWRRIKWRHALLATLPQVIATLNQVFRLIVSGVLLSLIHI